MLQHVTRSYASTWISFCLKGLWGIWEERCVDISAALSVSLSEAVYIFQHKNNQLTVLPPGPKPGCSKLANVRVREKTWKVLEWSWFGRYKSVQHWGRSHSSAAAAFPPFCWIPLGNMRPLFLLMVSLSMVLSILTQKPQPCSKSNKSRLLSVFVLAITENSSSYRFKRMHEYALTISLNR